MRVMIAAAGGLLAVGAALGTRPTSPRSKAVLVGRELRSPSESSVNPDDVSLTTESGARYFSDGALVGFWRSLRACRVTEVDEDGIATVEPDWEGDFVPPDESAAAWAERESAKGRYVIGPILLAYDTGAKRILWSSDSDEPTMGTDVFAVVLPPHATSSIRELANQSESGG